MLHPPQLFQFKPISCYYFNTSSSLGRIYEHGTCREAKNCKALDNCISNQIYLSLSGEIQVVWLFINKCVKLNR